MPSFIGPNSTEYSFDHLDSFVLEAKVTLGDDEFIFPLKVKFRWHCWSRDIEPNDDPGWVLPANPNEPKPRAFCPDRWEYSKKVVAMLKAAPWRVTCHATTKAGHYFRLEQAGINANRPGIEGWYMFYQLNADLDDSAGLEISIESVHYRDKLPTNARGTMPIAFWRTLVEYLRTRPDIQSAFRKAKGP